MENMFVNNQKEGHEKEESFHDLSKGELSRENGLNCSELKSRKLVSSISAQNTLILSVKRPKHSKSCLESPCLRDTYLLDNKIPKRLVTLDEKYLRRCLELVHISALKAAQCCISVESGSMKMRISPYGLNAAKIRDDNICHLARFVFEDPLPAVSGNVVISSAGHWIIGSIMGSKSMMHILKSPLLRKLGAFDIDSNFGRSRLNDVKGLISSDFMSSPGGLSNYSPQKLENNASNEKYGSGTVHKRLVSVSSTNSTCSSDKSCSSASPSVSQGMLQCTWKGGIPHFVFSLDDQREVYVADLCRTGSTDDKALDYMYLFHLTKGNRKKHDICDNESQLVGKMKVSTSFSLCPNNSKIMERDFTLFAGGGNSTGGTQTPCHNLKKNKGLSKKVVNAFRSSHSSRQKSISKFGGLSSMLEYCPWEPYQDTDNNFDAQGGANLLENHLPSNLESAAIVVKEHLPDSHQHEVGGWGLKFLRKVGVKRTSDTVEASVHSACCNHDTDGCSTSMDVLVPAGIHGGPRSRIGGPSRLIERWKSGGYCDCGGWDLGCPLTVLKTRSGKDVGSQTDMEEDCKLFDLSIEGSMQGTPNLRMVNVHDGLYFIHFQSTLSALQSFSIAVAYIHSQSPILRPKNVEESQ